MHRIDDTNIDPSFKYITENENDVCLINVGGLKINDKIANVSLHDLLKKIIMPYTAPVINTPIISSVTVNNNYIKIGNNYYEIKETFNLGNGIISYKHGYITSLNDISSISKVTGKLNLSSSLVFPLLSIIDFPNQSITTKIGMKSNKIKKFEIFKTDISSSTFSKVYTINYTGDFVAFVDLTCDTDASFNKIDSTQAGSLLSSMKMKFSIYDESKDDVAASSQSAIYFYPFVFYLNSNIPFEDNNSFIENLITDTNNNIYKAKALPINTYGTSTDSFDCTFEPLNNEFSYILLPQLVTNDTRTIEEALDIVIGTRQKIEEVKLSNNNKFTLEIGNGTSNTTTTFNYRIFRTGRSSTTNNKTYTFYIKK